MQCIVYSGFRVQRRLIYMLGEDAVGCDLIPAYWPSPVPVYEVFHE